MTTTTAAAIPTGLNGGSFGTFESGPKPLRTLNDRDIYEIEVTGAVGAVIALTEVISALTDGDVASEIGATNRLFLPNAFATSSGNPASSVAPVDSAGSVFLGVSTASSPNYNLTDVIADPGADIVFSYQTSIALVKTVLDINNDTFVRGAELQPLVIGTSETDILVGNDELNVMLGFGGDDDIRGGSGDDEIDGGSGSDFISGQLGNDTLRGGDGDDTIFGGLGVDTINGNGGNDKLRGGDGGDIINGGSGNDIIGGESGNDVLTGGNGDDEINGGLGFDSISGGGGNDLLRGLDDDDFLLGNDGNDDLRGNDGEDFLEGGLGDDVLRGQGDDDNLSGDDGSDMLFGGFGNDFLDGGLGDDILRGGSGGDLLVGGDGNDSLSGEVGRDSLFGGNGNDRLTGGFGMDTYRGYGDGSDATERDILVGNADGAVDTFLLSDGDGNTFYDEGGFADFAILRNITIDRPNFTSGFEDRIFLANGEGTYFLEDVSSPMLTLGAVSGVGIFLDNDNPQQGNDLIAVIENVLAADIQGGIANDLFVV